MQYVIFIIIIFKNIKQNIVYNVKKYMEFLKIHIFHIPQKKNEYKYNQINFIFVLRFKLP